jgi:hypothetical protein
MKRSILFLICLSVTMLSSLPAWSYVGLCCAKCGGNMPMNIPGGGVPETCEFRLKITPMYMYMNGLLNGTDSVSANDILGAPAPGVYMAAPTKMYMGMVNLSAGYSFTDDIFGGIMFMFKDNNMRMKFSPMMQTMTGESGFNMKSEGMGDTMLMGKYRLYTDDPLIPTSESSLFFGLSLPTGSINEKNSHFPLPARRDEALPYGMQLGSGTFDPMLGLLYQGSSSPLWWGADASYTARLYDNARDYHLGNDFRYDLYGMYQFRYDMLSYLQLNGRWWGKIHGKMDESLSAQPGHANPADPSSPYMTPLWDPENYGGQRVAFTLGMQWQPFPLNIVDFGVQIPAYQNLNGPQLKEEYMIMLTYYIEIPTPSSVRYRGEKKEGSSRLGF